MTISTLKKHLNLRIGLYALSTCFTIITMFFPISCKKQKEDQTQQSVEILRKEHEHLKQSVQVKVQILNRRNDSLQYQLLQVNRKLANQKSEHLIRRVGVKNMLQPHEKDTLKTPCDSIRETVLDYVKSDEQQDSLYELSIVQLEAVVEVKDSCIDEMQEALITTQELTDRSLNQQAQLEKVLVDTQKQLKRKQILNRLLGAGTLVLAGATAILIIR